MKILLASVLALAVTPAFAQNPSAVRINLSTEAGEPASRNFRAAWQTGRASSMV